VVCGELGAPPACDVLQRRLTRDGHCAAVLTLGGWLHPFHEHRIDACAEQLRGEIERLYARYEMGPLSLIGHGKGGLIARYYAKRLGGDRRVRNLITLGTPHNGTPRAYLDPTSWQMTPMSRFIRRLKMGAFPQHVRFVSIYSKEDRVNPFPSCILETNGHANLLNIEVHGVTHRQYLMNRGVYQVIRRELAAGFGEERKPLLSPVTFLGQAQ
jgi:pimeloyl-ACP methyl ester carboxylesterase